MGGNILEYVWDSGYGHDMYMYLPPHYTIDNVNYLIFG